MSGASLLSRKPKVCRDMSHAAYMPHGSNGTRSGMNAVRCSASYGTSAPSTYKKHRFEMIDSCNLSWRGLHGSPDCSCQMERLESTTVRDNLHSDDRTIFGSF